MAGWNGKAAGSLTIGNQYTRAQICDLLGVPEDARRGDWNTGYHRHNGEWFIFANVGIPGRTGNDYANQWIGDDLQWEGKTNSRLGQPVIDELVGGNVPVHVFWRTNDRDPFAYAGLARALKVKETTPVRVLWGFGSVQGQVAEGSLPEEIPPTQTYTEGAAKSILVNAYERNPAARKACLAHHGFACAVCGFDFRKFYGERGQGFIHVHHVRAIADIGAAYEVNPIEDLRPVCPNCHAMIHRQSPALSIEDLRAVIEQQRE